MITLLLHSNESISPPLEGVYKARVRRVFGLFWPKTQLKRTEKSTELHCVGALLGGGIFAYSFDQTFSFAVLLCVAVTGWLGTVQILNSFSPSFPRPLRRAVHWLYAMSFESLAILLSAFLHPTCYFSKRRTSAKGVGGRPILLIHGYLHNSSAWFYQRRKLTKEGFGPIYLLNLKHPFRSIAQYAKEVQKKAEEIEQETKRSDLILIGHSMGGLVCCFYATELAPPGKVTDVITIGSPLAGTPMACFGLGPSAREMACASPLLKELRQKIAQHTTTRFYHIAAETDQLVFPFSSALVGDHIERQFILKDLGHVGLLFSSRVAQKICSWLKSMH